MPNKRAVPRDRREAAEALAVHAISFLADDPKRLARFLALSGLDPERIRSAAGEAGFLAGVLDYLGSDDGLLLSFAAHVAIDPAEISRARTALAGESWLAAEL
jgi:Protein of unknown function (DUF3572)